MIDKKQTGGLEEGNEDLIQPGHQELDTNNLINTVTPTQPFEMDGGFPGSLDILQDIQRGGSARQQNMGGDYYQIDQDSWDEYNRLIPGGFSLSDRNLDDKRADGQSFAEKAWYSYGVKLAPKIGTHIIGSTYGLVDGLGRVASDAYENGFAASNWNKFFNNDFQRSLDDFNKALDNKFPVYHNSMERDYNFKQKVFGPGAANFWTEQFSQGLSFVAGAVLSEMATAGTASFMIGPKAANNLKRIAALRSTAYAQKSSAALSMLNKISKADQIYGGLTAGRRLMTGAFYEAGVESRHNYDQIIDNLSRLHLERTNRPPTDKELAQIHDTAVKISNGVFAGNAALVGYSNALLFRRVFGSGLNANKKFKNQIVKDAKSGKYKARHKDWGAMRSWLHRNVYGQGAWGRYAAYEGIVEEGGQKTLDLAGQFAAENLYIDSKTPSQMQAIGELLMHTYKGMEQTWGSTEGQTEMFLGGVLAFLGLPSFMHTNEKGERSFKIGYGKTGGIIDYLNQYRKGKQDVEDLVKYMNENPDVMGAIKNNFDMLNEMETANDKRDMADATNNDFAYKNAEDDAFFAYAFARIKGGYYGDVVDSLEDLRGMSIDQFEATFGYEKETENMSKKERENFLNDRLNTVVDSHINRAKRIKQIYDSLDQTRLNDKSKKIYAQALSTTNNLDEREEKVSNEIEEDTGGSLTAITNKQESDRQANNNIFSKFKNFTMKLIGRKAKDVMENSEVGKEIKKEIGIKEFTEPGHPSLVLVRMAQKRAALKEQQKQYEAADNVDGYIEVTEQIEALEEEMLILDQAITQGTAPNISSEEQQILDAWKERDPAGYELKHKDVIKKLQDLRRIRAKRHQMLNLIQRLIDPEAANDTIQQFEEVVTDMLTEEERKNLPDSQQRLARKYKGKILEFDYTNKKGETKRHRVYFKNAGNNGLVKLPNEETFKLLKRQEALLKKGALNEDEQAELDLIKEELKRFGHITKFDSYDLSILEKAENITVLSEQELVLKQLQAITNILQDDLAENLSQARQDIKDTQGKIVSLAEQIKDIKEAIKQAKQNKKGALYVNLNRIGRKGNFSIQGAKDLLIEIKTEEYNYKQLLKQFNKSIAVLNDNALRIQAIHTTMTNPDVVSDILGKAASRTDVLEFLNDLLGLTSIEDFYKKLGEQGFFDTNELTKLAGQKNKDGNYEVDLQILEDLLKLATPGSNIAKEYLELMNTDLEHFKEELKLLSQHRKDVERMLSRMIDPSTQQPLMFPPDGLTEEDLKFLTHELRMVDEDIKTLKSIIEVMEAETEEAFRDAINSDPIQERQKGIAIQNEIFKTLNEYEAWIREVTTEPAEEASLEEGENSQAQDDIVNKRHSPSFMSYDEETVGIGWLKTAGNHAVALKKWRETYKRMLENNQKLTPAEEMHLQHIKAQLRFFKLTPDITNWTKNKGYRLQIVTRYNIRPEWKDKIVFFDISKAEKSGRYDDLSNFQYADNLTENTKQLEELENIKLLIVDSNNQPVLVDGELAYTDMNSSSENNSKGEFKGDESKDLKDGKLKPKLVTAQEAFKAERNKILFENPQQERYFYITGKSRGMPIKSGSLNPVLGRIKVNKSGKYYVAKEEDLKDTRLSIALPNKGSKGRDTKVTLFGTYRVPSGFAYFGTQSKGYNGTSNLVPAIVSPLSENRVNNIYNLSRYFAENQEQEGGGINIGGKGFTTILKEQIMFGRRSEERSRKQYSIYLKDDAIHFGDQGQSITLEQLKDPNKYEAEHNAYKEFLQTLYFNINSTILNRDLAARKKALEAGLKTKAFIKPEYEKFNEVIVNDDLSTDVIEWDNYTHYLISNKGRKDKDVPVQVDMPLAFNNQADIEHSLVPQFLNVYLEHSSESLTAEQMNSSSKDSNVSKVTKEERKEVKEEKKEDEKYEYRTVVNTNTGERKRILVKVATQEEEKLIEESDLEQAAPEQPDDTLEDSPFSQSSDTDLDDPYFLANLERDDLTGEVNLDEELKWFNANMPKDQNGNPLVGIDMIKGLIDGKAYGKFTKDGNILLSNLLDTPGIVYHESWHAITRRFVSPEERFALYDEVRGMRGSVKTYKGETKKMSELTDKEADEWLAEEFREYVLAKGNYTIGGRIKKSILDRIFDRIFKALNFFIGNKSQAQELMEGINTGKFSNPKQELTMYDSKSEAYYEGTKLTATMKNNTMEGMTVILFNKALKNNVFSLEDFVNPKKFEAVNTAINQMYGATETPGSVYSQIEAHIKTQLQRATTQQERDNLISTMSAIKENWDQLKRDHAEYLERFNIELSDEVQEQERIREQFGKPQNEIDPSIYLPKAVRILLGTLPQSRNGKFIINSSGLPRLVDFGSIMNFMYKEMANTNPLDFAKNLKNATEKRPEIKSLINRLGIESEDWSDKTSDQMRLLIQTMMQFDQSNNTFYTQLITREGGRLLINSNQNRVQDKVKLLWKNNFKTNIQNRKNLGEEVNGELVINPKAKIKVGNKSRTFNTWANDARRTAEESLEVLEALGITFTNQDLFVDLYNEEATGINSTVNYILNEIYNTPVSDLFEGDILGNLNTLIQFEAEHSPITVDLQHRSPEGKTVHGVNLKTYADVLLSKLHIHSSTREDELQNLLSYDNLKGSHYLISMLNNPSKELKLTILQGIEKEYGRGKILSKSSPVDIGVMTVNAVLSKGIVPLIRTADKKTEYGLQFDIPSLVFSREEMIGRLQGYLRDELKVASKFNSRKKSKLKRISTIKDEGGNLKFFKNIVPSIAISDYNKMLSEEQLMEIVSRESVILDLNTFLENSIQETLDTFNEYNILAGIDQDLMRKVTNRSGEMAKKPVELLGEQFTYEYMTGMIEQSKLFLGDFGLYGDNLFKRTSGISGTKTYPTSNTEILGWMNTNMPNLLSNKDHSGDLRVVNRSAVKTEAPYLEQYLSTLDLMGLPFEFMQNVNEVYSNMEEFDGGGFITLDAYRSLLYRTGKWSPAQEEFYQKLAANEQISSEEMAVLPPLKPQLFGPQVVDNTRLMTYHKFALFPIIPQLMGPTFNTINQDMIANKVDYMIFESAVKVGGVTEGQAVVDPVDNPEGYDPFYQEQGEWNAYKPMTLDEQAEPIGLQELNFEDFGVQVDVAPKVKDNIPEGTQLRHQLPVNIYDRGELAEEYKDFESLIDRYHNINNTLVKKDFNSLLKKLKLTKDQSGIYKLESNDLAEFKKVLIDEFKKRDNPRHTIASLEGLLDSDSKFIDQLFERNKIENLLYSLVNNNAIKRTMPGSQFVLQAVTGFEGEVKAIKQNDFAKAEKNGIDLHSAGLKPLKFYRKRDPKNLNSETLAMQVYLPSRFKDKFGKDINDIKDIDPELLQLIGFRIPTEGLNSMDFIEIVGFLPKSFGDTVIVPSEIVGKAGSDYDIDKLNIYFPNSYRDGDFLKRIKFDPEKSVAQQGKKALQNELQTIIRDILSHPVSFDQLIAPVGAYKLERLAKEVAMLRDPNSFDAEGKRISTPLNKALNLKNMMNTSYRMFSGLGGIGIVATSGSQHAKGQRPGINWNFAAHEDIKFNFQGEDFSLSRVYDVRGRQQGDKISSTIGQYVTGYVDVTKADFVFDINAGIDYAPIHMLLVRSGVPLETVVYFMSQPIIDDYVKSKEINQPMYATFPLKTDDQIVAELELLYGKEAIGAAPLTVDTLKEMIKVGKSRLDPVQKKIQVQILRDFKRYEELAKDLMLLKNATSLDTSQDMTSSMGVRYTKQAMSRLEQDGRFSNLDELLYGNQEGPSTIAGYTELLNNVDGMFAEFKLGEYLKDAKTFIDSKLFESTDKESNLFKDDIIYTMKKFESFLATYIVQNTPWDYTKLNDRALELFKGENSLPKRINRLKKLDNYKDNLLIQELTPILQVYTEASEKGTVDGLRLFSKKLQPYDIDLMADAFMELKEINPELANDLIVFSAMQSGYEFNPNSFFQVIPGVEVLSMFSKYFEQNKKEDRTSNLISNQNMEDIWTDFNKNYHMDNRVVYNMYRKNAKEDIELKRNNDFISITTKTGSKMIGNREVNSYETYLYKNTKTQNKAGQYKYIRIDKKGVRNNLIEAGINKETIVNKNIIFETPTAPEIANTNITIKRNLGGEAQTVITNKNC